MRVQWCASGFLRDRSDTAVRQGQIELVGEAVAFRSVCTAFLCALVAHQTHPMIERGIREWRLGVLRERLAFVYCT